MKTYDFSKRPIIQNAMRQIVNLGNVTNPEEVFDEMTFIFQELEQIDYFKKREEELLEELKLLHNFDKGFSAGLKKGAEIIQEYVKDKQL